MSLRVSIVGAGRMGRERARSVKLLGGNVVQVCDTAVDRAAALASDVGAAPVGCPNHLDVSKLDAVFVCTPPAFRGQVEARAIEAGVPFFVEKPIGLDAHRCAYLIEKLRAHPVINAVGYMNRYRNSVLLALQEIKDVSAIGVAFQWFAAEYRVPWWLDPSRSGGPINEQCTHYIDLCRFLVGEISEVQAVSRALAHAPASEGTAAISLLFQNEILGTGLYSCEASHKQMAFEVFLRDRSIRLQGWDFRLTPDSDGEDIFLKEVSAFFLAVQSGDSSLIYSNFDSALKTQSVVDAIRRAIRTGGREKVVEPGKSSFAHES